MTPVSARRQRCRQSGGEQAPPDRLGRSCEHGVHLCRAHPDGLHHRLGAGTTGTAEPAEELLRAVPDEQATDHRARHQASDAHASTFLPA